MPFHDIEPTHEEILEVLRKFSAQLGETAWHGLNIDSSFDEVSNEHTNYISSFIKSPQERSSLQLADMLSPSLSARSEPLRFLEVAPYLHTTAQALNRDHGVEATACDISPHSLRAGRQAFAATNTRGTARLVTADFHDLPFEMGAFDLVFIASAVHHTLSPARVLSELVRVTRPGGHVLIYNEPVASEGCFYQFRSSRTEALSRWEQLLADEGLIRIVSSPFPGSRCEQLFGMVENDRIPLDIFLNTSAEVVSLQLTPQPSALDAQLAKHGRNKDAIEREINQRLERARLEFGHPQRLMGFSLPSHEEVGAFATAYAERLERIGALSGEARNQAEARLYGASIRMVLRKPGDGPAADPTLRGCEELEDGLFVSPPLAGRVLLHLGDSRLPAISADRASELEPHYPPEDWLLLDQGPAYAETMTGRSARLALPQNGDARQILLVRFYAVAHPDGPYWVRVRAGDTELAAIPICESESHLVKAVLPPGCREVQIDLAEDGRASMDFHLNIRVAFADVVACSLVAGAELARVPFPSA